MPLGRGGRMIVVVGMAFEARIAAGLGVRVICGGDGRNLAPTLSRAMAAGCGGLISFGVAGGPAPALKPRRCVIGSRTFHHEGEGTDRARSGPRAVGHLSPTVFLASGCGGPAPPPF